MSGFYYFLPNVEAKELFIGERLQHEVIKQRSEKLAFLLNDCNSTADVAPFDVTRGPGGLSGCVLYPLAPQEKTPPRGAMYDQAKQTWRMVGKARVWGIGYNNDSPPTPVCLTRRKQVAGTPIPDARGNVWVIPTLRAESNPRGRLTASFSWNEDDQPVVGVDRRHRELWEDSARVWDMLEANAPDGLGMIADTFSVEEDQFLFDFVVRCLGVNYRVNNAVLATLDRIYPDFLHQDAASLMLNAAVDMFMYRRMMAQKKTSPADSPSSSTGAPAVSTASGPAEEN